MLRHAIAYSLSTLILAAGVSAAVIFEIEVEDHGGSPPKRRTVHVSAEGTSVRMDVTTADRSQDEATIIFHGEPSEMIVLDHRRKSYFVVDEAMVRAIAAAIDPTAADPPRDAPASARYEYRKTGATETINTYPTERYDVYDRGEKDREVWISDWKHIEGGAAILAAFDAIARFGRPVIDILGRATGDPNGIPSQLAFLARMKELDGFPVSTRRVDRDGRVETVTRLLGSRERDVSAETFEIPGGYQRQQMFSGM